jgi:hypothetical protein
MENKQLSKGHSAVLDRPLSLPHFDEDATLLSARPVVPLHEVRAETRSRRRLVFGLTIVAAILGGAISALLLVMQSGRSLQSVADFGDSQLEVLSSGATGSTISESAQANVPRLTERVEEPYTKEVSTRDSSIRKRQTTEIPRRSIKPAVNGNPDLEADDEFESEERSLRRSERRNARREARRERRQRREESGDDLLRIREIFEGHPRP